jgi:aerobic carbon-monoxide dehydrogenase medium subunit
MIPASFDYVRASSLAQTISLLQQDPDGSKLLAGGHTLIPTLKLRLASPALLIDIGGLEELKEIELADRIRIGALTTHAELLASEPLRKILPIFHQTAELISDPQVRNRGTIGGSLSNADPAADWPAVAIAVKAELELAGPVGRRHVAAKDFFIDIMTTALDPGEVLVALNIPRPNPGAQFRYRKIRHPASGYAVVGVAVALCLQDGIVSEDRHHGRDQPRVRGRRRKYAPDRKTTIRPNHHKGCIACQRAGRMPVGSLRAGDLSQASPQDRSYPVAGFAECSLTEHVDLSCCD